MPYKTPHEKLILTFMLLAMLLALPLALSQTAGSSTGTETGAETRTIPERLALRLLSYPGDGREVELFVGEAPAPLEGILPALEGVTILGGLQHGDGSVTVVADAALPAHQVIRLYRERLMAEGWREVDPEALYGRQEIFVPAADISGLLLCRDEDELQLATAGRGEETDVQLNFSSATEYSACNPNAGGAYGFGDEGPLFDLIPPLVAPEGSQQRGGGRSGGGDSFLAENRLVTELDAAALAEHYALQLEAAGWEPDGERVAEDRVWRAFALRADGGQLWQVILVVRTGAGEGEQNIYMAAF